MDAPVLIALGLTCLGCLLLLAANQPLYFGIWLVARVELLWLCAAAWGLLPVLNMLTTSRHLGRSIPQGEWIMAGFDLAALGCGLIAVLCAWKVARSAATSTVRRRPKTHETAELVTS